MEDPQGCCCLALGTKALECCSQPGARLPRATSCAEASNHHEIINGDQLPGLKGFATQVTKPAGQLLTVLTFAVLALLGVAGATQIYKAA